MISNLSVAFLNAVVWGMIMALIALGLNMIFGLLHIINMVGMTMAREMLFTAQPVPAARALQIGLLNHLVPLEELEEITYEMARTIAENSPISISVIKEQLRLLSNALPLSSETFERIQGLRRQVYDSHDFQEGQKAFLEKRKPIFKGE